LDELTVAVLGAGKIGSIFVEALSGSVKRVIATGRREETLRKAEELGAEATRDNRAAVARADVVILSVKPYQAPALIKEIASVAEGKIFVSLMAGIRRATLQEALDGGVVFRAMPNVSARVRGSATAVAEWEGYSNEDRIVVEELLGLVGKVYWIPEEWLDAWTALVGSCPAYIAEIVDALALGAVSTGLPRSVAYTAILETVKAAAELLMNGGRHPAELRDEVTTPAGTTIEGLKVIEKMGVKAALIEVVEAATRRSRELGSLIDEEIRRSLEGKG
jgi:pyrroline-5-carboxylate reductase